MDLRLYNSLTRKKEVFHPLKKGEASLYVCGITPYDEPHIGHARCYVVFDLVRRVLEWRGMKVRHIQNFTDVDDKIIARAKEKKESPSEVAEENIRLYLSQMGRLHIQPPDDYPRVTKSIPLILRLINRLIEKKLAYEAGGDVYFSVRAFRPYGRLSGRNIDELESGARVEPGEHKRDPLDFALWKKSKEGEPFWDSPWGKGRPGWHIECSAMSMDRLGDKFDIHGGGQDLIFPHHENEIAQSNGATGLKNGFAQRWIHNGFVTINKEKMSKSLGNFFTLRAVLERYDPMAVRYFLLSQHYRSPLNFSDADLTAAQTAWRNRVTGAYGRAVAHESDAGGDQSLPVTTETSWKKTIASFDGALLDDLNTPAAFARLNDLCSLIFGLEPYAAGFQKNVWTRIRADFQTCLDRLGFEPPRPASWPPDVLKLVEARETARKKKDFVASDRFRNELKAKGVVVEDTPTGPRLKNL